MSIERLLKKPYDPFADSEANRKDFYASNKPTKEELKIVYDGLDLIEQFSRTDWEFQHILNDDDFLRKIDHWRDMLAKSSKPDYAARVLYLTGTFEEISQAEMAYPVLEEKMAKYGWTLTDFVMFQATSEKLLYELELDFDIWYAKQRHSGIEDAALDKWGKSGTSEGRIESLVIIQNEDEYRERKRGIHEVRALLNFWKRLSEVIAQVSISNGGIVKRMKTELDNLR